MSRITEVFGIDRVLLPVVHPVSEDEALNSIGVAIEAGVRGVFLIDQGMSSDEVLDLVMIVRKRHPSLWVGVNLLGTPVVDVLRRGLERCEGRLDGIWTDTAGVDDRGAEADAEEFVAVRTGLGWRGLYFGGTAFKYQREIPRDQLGTIAGLAARYVDVVCTSGPGTAKPAAIDKVSAMRAGMGAGPSLALASGVDETNAAGYLPFVDAYLVGTSLEVSFGILDPRKTARLRAIIEDTPSARATP